MSSPLVLPQTSPVMILPECNFFPFTPLPLRVFEPRYRAMLAAALEGDRMFCVGTRILPGETAAEDLPVDEGAGIYVHGTIGLVRACVTNPDGTSHLLLEGLGRVLFAGWIREEPYRIAAVQAVETVTEDEETVRAGTRRVLVAAGRLVERGMRCPPQLDLRPETALPPEVVADVVANYFLGNVRERHELLAMDSLDQRLEFLERLLKGQLGALGSAP
jgi:ATP-dependent Lon protease